MKRILTILLLLLASFSHAQSFTFDSIPYTATDIISPGRGAEKWHSGSDRIPYPTADQAQSIENSLDTYHRFGWAEIEGPTLGSYNWAYFDTLVATAIKNNQKISFGIMTLNPDELFNPVTYPDGKASSYPLYLHTLMQGEVEEERDWLSGNVWVPNYNSEHYLSRLLALHEALNAHILTKTYYIWPAGNPRQGQTVNFRDAIYAIDIRGYGSWGEWNTSNTNTWDTYPAGRQPTVQTLKTIIDHHTNVFNDWPLSMMIAGYNIYPDQGGCNCEGGTAIDLFHPYAEVAHYAMDASNDWGPVGFRRDQVGAPDGYLHSLLENNTGKWPEGIGLTIGQKFINKYKTAPGTGEPMPFVATQANGMTDVLNQIELYHHVSFGNGNYIGWNDVNETVRARLRAAFKRAGYRFKLTGGSATPSGSDLTIEVDWSNIGVTPTYEKWHVVYELRSGGEAVWSDTSYFNPFLFLPGDSVVVDEFSRSGMPQGIYDLYMIIKDSTQYRDPLPLAIEGRESDGAYLLLADISIPAATGDDNAPPNASAELSITITQPTSQVTVHGDNSSDPDGTIVSYLWEKISGPAAYNIANPNSANTIIDTLTAGIYVFRLTVTDDEGATDTHNVTVTVNAISEPVLRKVKFKRFIFQ